MVTEPDLKTRIGPLELKNPVLLASGTCGYGGELADLVDLNLLGGIVVKGLSLKPREGNPPPRVWETPCGLLNSIGLENVGVESFVRDKLPYLSRLNTVVIANILGESVDEYARVAEMLSASPGLDAIEVNISCPNVKAGGAAFGTDPEMAAKVSAAVKKATPLPVICKLSPNVTDIVSIARAVEDAGADALSLINTLIGMAIDIEHRRPALANVFGGLSGPAIRPVAVRMVYEAARAVRIPVMGIGGISTGSDAVEFMLAGARAIQIGTATLVRPDACLSVIQGIAEYMKRHGLKKTDELRLAV